MSPLEVVNESISQEHLDAAEKAAAVLREQRKQPDADIIRDVLVRAGWRYQRGRDVWTWKDGTEILPPRTLRDAVVWSAAAGCAAAIEANGEG